jgi:hypothetical protein
MDIEKAKRIFLESKELDLAREWSRDLTHHFYEESYLLSVRDLPWFDDYRGGHRYYQYRVAKVPPEFLSDEEIAKKNNIPVDVVVAYRERNGIPDACARMKKAFEKLFTNLQDLARTASLLSARCVEYQDRYPKFKVMAELPKSPLDD